MVKYMQNWYVVALNIFPHTVHTQKDTPPLNLHVYHTVFEQSWIHRHAELLGMPWLWLYASHAHWTCKHSQKSPALYGCQSGSLNDFNANPPNNRHSICGLPMLQERQQLKPQYYAFRWITLLLSQEFFLPGEYRGWEDIMQRDLQPVISSRFSIHSQTAHPRSSQYGNQICLYTLIHVGTE